MTSKSYKILFIRIALSLMALSPIIANAQFNAIQANVSNTLCGVYKIVHNTILIVGLTLMVLGAVLYGGANLLPAGPRGQLQGYGMGMLFGGVVGVVISLIAPFLLAIITNNTIANIVGLCP